MKRTLSLIMTLLLAVALIGCGQAEALTAAAAAVQPVQPAAEADPLAAPTSPDVAVTTAAESVVDVVVTGSAEGTVLAMAPNDMTVNLKNGDTINFMLNNIAETDAMVGDEVMIEYSGDLLNRPEAVTVTVTEKSPAQTLTGTVFQHDKESIFVQISSQQVFGFVLNKDTLVEGAADYVVVGDTVMLTYDGDLYDTPTAVRIIITEANKDRTDATAAPTDDPTNKTLDGVVKSVTGSKLTILTSRSKTYTFKIDSTTRITGKYALVAGARVTAYYDGYASKSPLAKAVNVYAPPDPNPTPTPTPYTKTANGYVDSFGGMYLSLTSGIGFDCAYATYNGNSNGNPGDQARVTYYVGSDGMNYATYITFTAIAPDPTPVPKPTEKPTSTVTGTVSSFGGMYLSLTNGMGFDCTYATYSGDGERLPGDEARVTYYVGDDGMKYATKIHFTFVPDPEPDPSEFEGD